MRHKITIKKIEPVSPTDGLIGFADFSLDGWAFNSIAVFTRLDGGIRLVWPEKKRGLKKIAQAFPLDKELSQSIESQIFEAIQNDARFKDAIQTP